MEVIAEKAKADGNSWPALALMQIIPASVEQLIEEFAKLPGIGPRTAERLTVAR
jgi:3-methyladenine DNA glycosylase/8-oxoguanine DNA glycosylase